MSGGGVLWVLQFPPQLPFPSLVWNHLPVEAISFQSKESIFLKIGEWWEKNTNLAEMWCIWYSPKKGLWQWTMCIGWVHDCLWMLKDLCMNFLSYIQDIAVYHNLFYILLRYTWAFFLWDKDKIFILACYLCPVNINMVWKFLRIPYLGNSLLFSSFLGTAGERTWHYGVLFLWLSTRIAWPDIDWYWSSNRKS